MSSKPILFNTEMVKAILDGRKTQTRRAIKIKNKLTRDWAITTGVEWLKVDLKDEIYPYSIREQNGAWNEYSLQDFIKKYSQYQVGDILYVKEKCVDEYPNGFCFKEDYEKEEWNDKYLIKQYCNKLNARIFLKVTNVRVERLQDISVRDIEKVTGWKREIYSYSNKNKAFFKDYRDFWNSTVKDGYKWEDNPCIFVYEFERIEKKGNQDDNKSKARKH